MLAISLETPTHKASHCKRSSPTRSLTVVSVVSVVLICRICRDRPRDRSWAARDRSLLSPRSYSPNPFHLGLPAIGIFSRHFAESQFLRGGIKNSVVGGVGGSTHVKRRSRGAAGRNQGFRHTRHTARSHGTRVHTSTWGEGGRVRLLHTCAHTLHAIAHGWMGIGG